MNTFSLSRNFFSFSYEKKECKAIHAGLFYFIIDLNNKLAWKNEFGLPTHDTMEALSIGNKKTYLTALRELQEWGFISIVQESKNQYQSCIISICRSNNEPALDTALDTALQQHHPQHCPSTSTGIAPIDKQRNKETKKQENVGTKHFSPPTIEKVKTYMKEKGYTDFSERFHNYYESNGWLVGKNKMKDWGAAVRSWVIKDVNLKEGGTKGVASFKIN